MATDRIHIHPQIMLGKPVVRGTRITVELILRRLGEGASHAEILDMYPTLSLDDIRAAATYAADALAHEDIISLEIPPQMIGG